MTGRPFSALRRRIGGHLRAAVPLLWVRTSDPVVMREVVRECCADAGRPFVDARPLGRPMDVERLFAPDLPADAVVWCDGCDTNAPAVQRALADLEYLRPDRWVTAVIPTGWDPLPTALTTISAAVEVPHPDDEELGAILEQASARAGVLVSAPDRDALVRSARGLGRQQAQRVFWSALTTHPDDVDAARKAVETAKRETVHHSDVLEWVEASEGMMQVGGLDHLKSWLRVRGQAFSPAARAAGLPTPKGVFLMGVQGCGKSLAAKATAHYWQVPCIRLDLFAAFGSPHPESALRRALRTAEAVAPAVLWVDEIEKGFDGASRGVAGRLLGTLVTWLQEKRAELFVVATANQVHALPPELVRKGRFDEIFFVDLPDASERAEIFGVHLRKRGLDPSGFDVAALSAASDKLTGAEIEQAVIAGMFVAFEKGEPVATRHVRRAIERGVSLYETFESDIKALREWARTRAVRASTDRRKLDLFQR